MGEAYLVRRGGTGLKLNVIACASADALPGTASENTIAVITDLQPVGLFVQATEPQNPVEGDVWAVTTGGDALLFAASKKSVKVGLSRIEQYDGAAWVQKVGYVHAGNGWAPISNVMDLYNGEAGQTDGWQTGKGGGTATYTGTYMQLKITESGTGQWVSTETPIDLTGFTVLKADVNVTAVNKQLSQYLHVRLAVADSPDVSPGDESITTKDEITCSTKGERTLSYDISALNSAKYVLVGIGWPDATVRITRVWLERESETLTMQTADVGDYVAAYEEGVQSA